MKITFLCASALLIEAYNQKILVDGLIANGNIIEDMQKETEDAIIEQRGIFSDLDYLLITHKHEDHYDKKKVDEFIKNNPQTAVISPDSNLQPSNIDIIKGNHIEKGKFPIAHNSYLIQLEEGTILICGDADIDYDWFNSRFSDIDIKYLFVNPLYISSTPARKIIDLLSADKTFVYHIPPEENDQYGYRYLAQKSLSSLSEDSNVYLLDKKNMEL